MADAVAIEHFFIDAAGWESEQCLLLTDTSPAVGELSTLPNRENIDRWLKKWCWDTLKSGDLLWLFFSGYGMTTGDDDYLIPIDGNPADLAHTCLSIRHLYQQLHEVGANVFVFLDANRSQNMSTGEGIGKITAQLARDYQIPTFLSCQSTEFSHEASGLEHGLFTAALLESLNYHPDLNIETLESYLTSRIAELSEHHWKPIQTPMAILPTNASVYRPIFSATTQSAVSTGMIPQYSPPPKPQFEIPDTAYYTPPTPLAVGPKLPEIAAIVKVQAPAPPSHNFSNLIKVGALLCMLIGAGGGIYLSQTAKQQTAVESSSYAPGAVDTSPASLAALSQASLLVKPSDATSRYSAILAAQKIRTDDTAAPQIKLAIDKWSMEIYEVAQSFAEKGSWQIAIDTAKMIPTQATNYNAAQASMSDWSKK